MSQYWQNRFKAVEEMNNKTAKKTVQAITPAFDQAQAQIEKEINAWYGRFAINNEISLQEAKKLLNSRELKEFKWDVEEYIKYGRQNAIDQKWMKELENASARFHISRLEALKIRTQNAAERAFGNEVDQIDEMATRIYMDDYYHTAYEIQRGLGIGWDVSQIDQNKLDKIVSKPWTTDKQTFSDRIWKSKTQLVDSLHKELTQMCVLGKAPDQTINNIAKRMNVSKGQAGRLVMTEAAYFGSVAQKDCFNDLDVEKFEIVATLDSHTSDVCQSMDGQVFDMKDFQAGVTAPPFHCWCRSCTCPYFDDDDEGTRAARGEDGKTYQVPANMTYKDWKNSFVDGDSKKGLEELTDENLMKKLEEYETNIKALETDYKKATLDYMMDFSPETKARADSIREKMNPLKEEFASFKEKYASRIEMIKNKATAVEEVVETGKQAKTLISNCQSVEEVEELFKEQDWFIHTDEWRSDNFLTLEGCDLESAKAVYEAHEQFFDKYPFTINKLSAVSCGTIPSGKLVYADCMVGFGTGGITVNSRFFKDIDFLTDCITNDIKSGYHPVGINKRTGVVIHELGHALDDYLTNIIKPFGLGKDDRAIWVSDQLRPKVMKACGLKMSDIKTEVSEYATKSTREWFAECFSEYMTSENPRPVAVEFGKQLEELVKGLK